MSNEKKEQNAYFALKRIYIKDASFESPKSPEVFKEQWNPEVKLDLNHSSRELTENLHEVVIAITVTISTGQQDTPNDKENPQDKTDTIFVAEVQQAGVFDIKGLTGEELERTLSIFCLNILFPYAREAIDNMVTRGNFPPLMIAPINFNELYEAKKQRQSEN